MRVSGRLWCPPDRWRGFGGSFGGASSKDSSLSSAAEATSGDAEEDAAAGGGGGAAGERAAAGGAEFLAGCEFRLVDELGCGLESAGTRG